MPADRSASAVAVLVTVHTGSPPLTVVVSGWLSDRLRRRRIFVVWATMVITVGVGPVAAWPSWATDVVAAVVRGLGFGVYVAVHAAVITRVLPAAAGCRGLFAGGRAHAVGWRCGDTNRVRPPVRLGNGRGIRARAATPTCRVG